jgi:translation initiation factor 1A
MPRNTGGRKFKRKKKFSGVNQKRNREIVEKGPGQDYAKLTAALGEYRFRCITTDGEEKLAEVPGSFRRRYWFYAEDVVLVSIRSFEPRKCDILHKYNPSEIQTLTAEGKLPMLVKLDEENKQELMEEMEAPIENHNSDGEYETIDVEGL